MTHPRSNAATLPRKVWHFVGYADRFGAEHMPPNVEMHQYIKWYVNAWKGAGAEWLVAVNRLRGYPDYIWLVGAVVELLTVATNQGLEYQGYLVTGSKVPMTASDVGSLLRIDGRRALVVLTRCEAVGILERVEWPSPGSGDDIPDDPSLRLLQNVAEASRKTVPKGGGKRPFRPRNEGPPLSKSEKSEALAAQEKIEVLDAAAACEGPPAVAGGQPGQGPARLTCPRCGHIGKPRKAAKGWGAKAMQCTQCGHVTAIGQTPIPRSPTPSTSPDGGEGPGSPQDRPGGDPGPKALPVSDFQPEPSRVRLADILAAQGHRYSAGANAFGEQVCAAAGYVTCDRGEYVNEVAHWAKLWEQCRCELTEIGMSRVRAKVLRIAGRIRTGQQVCDAPQAYLERTMQNEIRDRKRAHRIATG